jgi:hypothetical protein
MMSYPRILSLGLTALVLLMAMPAVASATTLTSPPGTVYTGTIKTENEGSLTLTSAFGGFGAVTIGKSIIELKVSTHGASVTAGGAISTLDLTSSTGGDVTSPVATRGSLEFHGASTTGNATVTWLNAEVIVHNTAWGTCVFTTSSKGTHLGLLTGSNVTKGKATLHINSTLTGPCGTAVWEGAHTVVTPSTLEVH